MIEGVPPANHGPAERQLKKKGFESLAQTMLTLRAHADEVCGVRTNRMIGLQRS